MQLVLNTHGLALKVKEKVFYISDGKEHRKISPEQLNSIAITAPCMISSSAITLAADAGIPIYFYDRLGEARSSLRSPYFESLATLRRKQVYFSDSPKSSKWVIEQFAHKTEHQLQLLKYLSNRKVQHKAAITACIENLQKEMLKLNGRVQIPDAAWSASLMGWEGNQARSYWRCLGQCLPHPWNFDGRSRRPALDFFNALINYGYGMLYSIVEQALFAAGLDPHLGILHADEYDRPTLSYDLIEAFRPWLDRLVVEKILADELKPDFFEEINGGIYLNDNGKRCFIPAFNGWLLTNVRWQKRQLTREAQIFHAAAMLAKQINSTVKRLT